ncbi:MAG TPA: dihydrolipoamide acetyltransferase family protein [Actinomycetota bacterium]|nr:dihydrolipoamide acetyltransferase family protein [Actinomycetota bacterium]
MTDIVMPQLGETIVEGTILKWLRHEGENVALDEPLFEISTDKVDTEVPSPAAGRLLRILVREGETVAVGTVLAEISSGEAAAADARPTPVAAAPAQQEVLPERGPRSQILSPLVRKLADEYRVDLSQVAGTGTGGRITKRDVLALAASRGGPTPPASATPAPLTTGAVEAAPVGSEETVPMSHVRKAIARHMTASLQTTARAWTAVEVDVENIARLRERVKDDFKAREGFSLSYLPFVARATCDALLAHPLVNSELRGDEIVVKRYVNLGIAVAYDEGLIVPVVKGAEAMNLVGLARAINDIAVRVREHRLAPDEVHGGTFSITNPGPFGSLISVPIIAMPQAAILALDAVETRPVVIDDAIAIRHRVYISMSFDHRVIDGALAAQFLGRVKENLEGWDFEEDLRS